MKNNKTCGWRRPSAARLPLFQRIRAAHRADKKTRSGLPPGASCATLVNALFWKILVTRVNSFLWQANLLSCPGRSAARAISAFTRVFDAHGEWCAADTDLGFTRDR